MNETQGNIKTKIDFSSSSFKKYLANTSWLFFERFLRIGISFVVSIYVVRYLGPKDFGLYSYILSFSWLFASLSSLGLESISTREIVKHPDRKDEINGSVFFLRLMGSFVTIFITGLTLFLIGEETYTAILILIASSSFILILSNILLVARQRPVIIQSLFTQLGGAEPPPEEIEAYATRLKELKAAGAQIPLVQIYSATRPTHYPDCGHLPLRLLSRIAQQVRDISGLKAEVF